MASTFKFELVSPEKRLISEEVEHVVVPSVEGDFGVLPQHAPVLATLRPGILQVLNADYSVQKRIYVRGGIADVNANGLTVLAQQAVDLTDFDKAAIDQEIDKVQGELQEATDQDTKLMTQAALDQLEELKAGAVL